MKICPKCQTKNQESSNFCKTCGVKITGSQFQDKKEAVMDGKKTHFTLLTISMVVLALALGFVAYLIVSGGPVQDGSASAQPAVAANIDYAGQKISMADVQATVRNGKVSVPLDVVLEKRMLRFEHQVRGEAVPLLAYVTQNGKVVTAVSMCEPCRSTRFHIEGKTLVCNACGTRWSLDTLKGISGGCLNYPPDVIPSAVENGVIQIDQKSVEQWKPRV
jgi:uncharacterized protein